MNQKIKILQYTLFISVTLIFFYSNAFCQLAKTYKFNSGWSSEPPLSNSINDIVVVNDTIWVGTEKGLSLTNNNGLSWINFPGIDQFDNKGISAIAVKDSIIWVAVGYTTYLQGEPVQTGGGLHYSTNYGKNWNYLPQPVDINRIDTIIYGINAILAYPTTVPQYNITFDIALTKDYVWIASWAGMLRRKHLHPDSITWRRVILPPDHKNSIKPTDTLSFSLSVDNLNHLTFSIYASDDSTIWVGTAGGINKSTDGGLSWQKYTHQNSAKISGNFVVALKEQQWQSNKIIWAATVNANDPNETRGISYSTNGGDTWQTALLGEWAHNIAVKDSIVYVATDNGLYRSPDFGISWSLNGDIYDNTTFQRFILRSCYCVGSKGDTIWYGGPEGLAYTIDSPFSPFSSTWRIFRTYEPVINKKRTYAYPNPFSPDDEPTRIHYAVEGVSGTTQNVTIRIFDFAMQPVRTIIQNAPRQAGKEFDEIWNGRNDFNSLVANGVYFYFVETGNNSQVWGKILVLR